MTDGAIKVGIIGAGFNCRYRHIPGFQEIDGVEVVAVANRSRESGQKVADEFNIPTVYGDWRALLEDDGIDAVCIGTWPYMHRTLTLASLEKDKHVLCEARMAVNAQEAHDMLDAAKAKPALVTQIVPAPTTFKVDNLVKGLLADGYLGRLLTVEVQGLSAGGFIDHDSPLHWRHDRDLSGYNTLNIGIWYETLLRWVGRATKVMAMTQVNVAQRRGRGRTVEGHHHTRPRGYSVPAGQRRSGPHPLQRGHRPGARGRDMAVRDRGHPVRGPGARRLRRPAGGPAVVSDTQSAGAAVRLAGGGGIHRRDPGRGTDSPHSLRGRRPLHGMDRGRGPQRPDRPGHIIAAVNWGTWPRDGGPGFRGPGPA